MRWAEELEGDEQTSPGASDASWIVLRMNLQGLREHLLTRSGAESNEEVITIRVGGWVENTCWIESLSHPLTKAVPTSQLHDGSDRGADYSRPVTLARRVLNAQQTLRPKSSRLAVTRGYFPFAVDDDEKIARGRSMPVTSPTCRGAHKAELCRRGHRRQAERRRGRGVVTIGELDYDIFEVWFASVVGKESYVFHNDSKCDLMLLLTISLPRLLFMSSRSLTIWLP